MQRVMRGGFRSYTLVLCAFYLCIVFLFHSSLQPQQPRGISDHAHDDVPTKPNPKASKGDERVYPLKPVKLEFNEVDTPKIKAPELKHEDFVKAGDVMNLGPPGEQDRVVHMNQDNNVPPQAADMLVSPPLPCNGTVIEEEQKFVEVSPDVRIFSVYWDERPNDFDNLSRGYYLRMMAVIHSRAAHMKRAIYCVFGAGLKTIPVQATYYEMCENHNRPYGGYILSCAVPVEIRHQPCTVVISPTPELDKGHQFKVQSTVAREKQRDFSVCVSPLFGDIDPLKLVEWLELSKLLGAQHINFYHYDLRVADSVLKRILQFYINLGFVSVVDWPLEQNQEKNIWYHGQLVAVQDCLYRNMATSKYVAFNDLDEFMVPHVHGNWSRWMAAADDDDKCAFQLQSVFFDPGRQDGAESVPRDYAHFWTLSDTKRSVTSSRVRTKCLIKAQKVFEAGIHHISKPIYANLRTERTELPTAVLHHHRTCLANYGMDCSKFTHDKIIPSQFGASLVTNVHSVFKVLGSELAKYTFDSGFKQFLQSLQ